MVQRGHFTFTTGGFLQPIAMLAMVHIPELLAAKCEYVVGSQRARKDPNEIACMTHSWMTQTWWSIWGKCTSSGTRGISGVSGTSVAMNASYNRDTGSNGTTVAGTDVGAGSVIGVSTRVSSPWNGVRTPPQDTQCDTITKRLMIRGVCRNTNPV
jgi:hypothetical protein